MIQIIFFKARDLNIFTWVARGPRVLLKGPIVQGPLKGVLSTGSITFQWQCIVIHPMNNPEYSWTLIYYDHLEGKLSRSFSYLKIQLFWWLIGERTKIACMPRSEIVFHDILALRYIVEFPPNHFMGRIGKKFCFLNSWQDFFLQNLLSLPFYRKIPKITRLVWYFPFCSLCAIISLYFLVQKFLLSPQK